MTREEAIKILEQKFDSSCQNNLFQNAEKLDYEYALWMAITALCPVSREQVERVRGRRIEDKYSFSHCSLCGYEQEEPELITPFCANCGAPMTDEAVQMTMERLEQVKSNE